MLRYFYQHKEMGQKVVKMEKKAFFIDRCVFAGVMDRLKKRRSFVLFPFLKKKRLRTLNILSEQILNRGKNWLR